MVMAQKRLLKVLRWLIMGFKEWMRKLKDWQFGLIIGILFPFIAWFLSLEYTKSNPSESSYIVVFLTKFVIFPLCELFGYGGGHPPVCMLYSIIFSPLVYVILGA